MALFANKSTTSGAAAPNYLAEIKCGRMKFNKDSKMVTPEDQKGLLYVEKNAEDGMLHLCWKLREKNSSTKLEDWLVFDGDVKVKLITQLPDRRVFFIKFNATNDRTFFWIQHTKKEKDIGEVEKLDMALNNTAELEKLNREKEKEAGKSGASEKGAAGGLDLGQAIPGIPKEIQAMLANDPSSAGMIQQLLQTPGALEAMGGLSGASSGGRSSKTGGKSTRGASSILKNNSAKGGKKGNVQIQGTSGAKGGTTLADLEKALAAAQQASDDARERFNLVKALGKDSLTDSLAKEETQNRLKKHMPETDKIPIDKSKAGIASTLSTPQYQQAVSAFQEALESRQLGQVLSQFDLPASAVKACDTGDAKQFAEALQTEFLKKPKAEGAQEGDEKNATAASSTKPPEKEDNNDKSEESTKSKDDEADKMAVD